MTRNANKPIHARRAALVIAAAIAFALPTAPDSRAQDTPLSLKWADLMPPVPPKGPRSIVAGRTPIDPLNPTHEQSVPEGRWLGGGGKSTPSAPAPIVESLNGKRVQLGGYVVPLDFDATSVKEFLLVPFVGACIHVPPPPANQIVYVQAPKGFQVKGLFEPVFVTGKIATTPSFTGLADAGYTLEAERVDPRKE